MRDEDERNIGHFLREKGFGQSVILKAAAADFKAS